MKLKPTIFAAAMVVCSLLATAGSSTNEYQLGAVECTQIDATHMHLSCKLSNSATGDKTDLSESLINYDVKNSDGKVIASGYGTTVYVDNSKLISEEEYSIVVYAIVNGNVVSQTLSRKAPAK